MHARCWHYSMSLHFVWNGMKRDHLTHLSPKPMIVRPLPYRPNLAEHIDWGTSHEKGTF
jgi:hypothetical protein